MKILHPALAAILLFASHGAQAQTVLAECGESSGHSYFLTPEEGWVDDRITGGSMRFTVDGAGNPNIIFVDASGHAIDAAADGGRLLFSRLDRERGEFGVVLIYVPSGVVETYNVHQLPGGGRRVLWTSNKPRIGSIGLTKVGAYVADCGS